MPTHGLRYLPIITKSNLSASLSSPAALCLKLGTPTASYSPTKGQGKPHYLCIIAGSASDIHLWPDTVTTVNAYPLPELPPCSLRALCISVAPAAVVKAYFCIGLRHTLCGRNSVSADGIYILPNVAWAKWPRPGSVSCPDEGL